MFSRALKNKAHVSSAYNFLQKEVYCARELLQSRVSYVSALTQSLGYHHFINPERTWSRELISNYYEDLTSCGRLSKMFKTSPHLKIVFVRDIFKTASSITKMLSGVSEVGIKATAGRRSKKSISASEKKNKLTSSLIKKIYRMSLRNHALHRFNKIVCRDFS